MPIKSSDCGSAVLLASANKCPHVNVLELGPRKCLYIGLFMDPIFSSVTMLFRTMQDPLVHHGCHFGRVVHAFCNVQTLMTNGIARLGEDEDRGLELLTAQ